MKVEWIAMNEDTMPEEEMIPISILVENGKRSRELEITTKSDMEMWDGEFFKVTHWLKGLKHPK